MLRSNYVDKITILVVDDEPINLKLVAQSLNERYDILLVRSGSEALDLLKNHYVALVLLDINMPHMNGFEVMKKLKETSETRNIPVIFLTANNTPEMIVKAFESGAIDYITKPFQTQELNARVDNHIRKCQLKKKLNILLQSNTHLINIINDYVSFVRVNPQGIIQEVSDAFCKQLQCTKENFIGKNINLLKSENTPRHLYKKIWETIESGKSFSFDINNRNFSGGINWYHVTISPDYNNKNEIIGYIGFYENIDEKIIFKRNSQTDKLTNLMNRSRIDEILLLEVKRAKREGHSFSVILVDIDYFKDVNDTYGHQAGDIVLTEFSLLLSNNIRETDYLGRWGGEEFLVICPNTDIEGAYTLAETLRKVVEKATFSFIGHKTASFGVAEFRKIDILENLFKNVDDALYTAKTEGRNQVKAYTTNKISSQS